MKRELFHGSTVLPSNVHAEQVALLYKNATLAYSTTLINGAILIFILSDHIPVSVLSVWYVCLVLVTVARAYASRQYARLKPGPPEAPFWNGVYLIGTFLAGCVWGSSALYLFPADSIAHQAFIAFVLAGMSAGAIGVLAPRMEVCFAFLLPALLPLSFRYLTLQTTLHTTMGIMTLLFLVGIIVTALSFHRAIRSTFILRFDKQELEAEIAIRNIVQEELFQERDRLQTTLSSIGEGVVLINAGGRISYMNRAAEQLCGSSHHEALHQPVGEIFRNEDEQKQRVASAMEESLHCAEQVRKKSVLYCKAGTRRIVEELATPLYDRHSKAVGAVSVLRDVTEAHKKTEQLAYAADHDALTGLPNRNLLKDRARRAIARTQRRHENFALLFLDLDYFKEVNDRYGHACGDALLIEVAKRLTQCVREEDTVSRLGGDEFVVLIDGSTQSAKIQTVADKILRALREPFQLEPHSISIGVSIGSSQYPENGQNLESLLEHADAAMYRAKKKGRKIRHTGTPDLTHTKSRPSGNFQAAS